MFFPEGGRKGHHRQIVRVYPHRPMIRDDQTIPSVPCDRVRSDGVHSMCRRSMWGMAFADRNPAAGATIAPRRLQRHHDPVDS